MSTENVNKFQFWMPASIQKGKDKEGNDVMRLGGIASTTERDADGEVLLPEGFDLSYFKKSGIVNWHHQSKKNPETIIGEPSKAEITKDGLYVETDLYKDSKVAKDVYNLAKVFQKNSKTRRLGYSIEGQVLERDPMDKSKVTKARITGLAVTHMPKNPKTLAEVIEKGMTGDEVFEYDDINISEEIEKATTAQGAPSATKPSGGDDGAGSEVDNMKTTTEEANGGKTKNISITVGDGLGGTIDVSKEQVTVNVNTWKATNTVDDASLKEEHIDGDIKDQEYKKKKKTLTKADVYKHIFSEYTDIEIDIAKGIYNLTNTIAEMDNTQITEDTLTKAKEILNLATPSADANTEEINKGGASSKKGDDAVDDASKKEKKEYMYMKDKGGNYRKMEKGGDGELKYSDDKMYEKTGLGYAEVDNNKGIKSNDQQYFYQSNGGTDGTFSKYAMKADNSGLEKADDNVYKADGKGGFSMVKSIEKGGVDVESLTEVIEKAVAGATEQSNKKIEALGVLLQNESNKNADLQKSLDATSQRTEAIASTPDQRRSVPTVGNYLEKAGHGTEEQFRNNGGRVLSVSQNKREILNVLDGLTFKGGQVDEFFAKGLTQFESSSVMPDAVSKALEAQHKIVITA